MYKRIAPIVLIALLLSLFGNAFFIFERNERSAIQMSEKMTEASEEKASEMLAPMAFGVVSLPALPQHPDACAALLRNTPAGKACFAFQASQGKAPIHEREEGVPPKTMTQVKFIYTSSGAIMPPLGKDVVLYRERGVGINFAQLEGILSAMGLPTDRRRLPIVPQEISYSTADGLMSITASLFSRQITIKRVASSSAPRRLAVAELPTKQAVIDAASMFAASLAIDVSAYPPPSVVGMPSFSSGSGVKRVPATVDVVWPMTVNGYEVINERAEPVSSLLVRYSLPEKRVTMLTFRPFIPHAFAGSLYPVDTSSEQREKHIKAGGFSPPSSFDRGKSIEVSYASPRLAYFLSEDPNHALATYLVPVILADLAFPPTCEACQQKAWRTFLPVTSERDIIWQRQ